jgi:hypothetical protein
MSKSVTQEELDRGDLLEDEDYSLEDEEENENLEDDEEEEELEIDDEDPEDEEEEDKDEPLEDEEEDEDEEVDEDGNKVPLARLNKVIDQRNQERERTARLEQQIERLIDQVASPKEAPVKVEPEEVYDFDVAESQYIEHILEGETEKAAKLRRQIDKERDKEVKKLVSEAKSSATEEAVTRTTAGLEEDRFNTLVATYEEKYTFLNADEEDYNEEAVDTVNALMNGFMKDMSKSKALKKAVDRIANMYEKAPEKPKLGGKGRKLDKTADRKRNAKVSQKQPPKTKGKGTKGRDLDSLDVSELTEEQFNNLSAKEKAILRGDL